VTPHCGSTIDARSSPERSQGPPGGRAFASLVTASAGRQRSRSRQLGRGSRALARRVPLRGGRNGRPVSPGPSGPTGVKLERPQAASTPLGRPELAGAGGRGRTSLTPGALGPDGISRRVRASAERGRVQGPGRAEADLGPRTVTATGNCYGNSGYSLGIGLSNFFTTTRLHGWVHRSLPWSLP
jgi:hypothetical protein